MTTEYIQPTNPIRIRTSGTNSYFTHPVFAIAIANDRVIEYLTINGQFYKTADILFAEQLIDGTWTKLAWIEKSQQNPA
jgi:guanylate kinase